MRCKLAWRRAPCHVCGVEQRTLGGNRPRKVADNAERDLGVVGDTDLVNDGQKSVGVLNLRSGCWQVIHHRLYERPVGEVERQCF